MPDPMRLRVLAGLCLMSALSTAGRPSIFVGIPPQRWLVRQLAGDRVDVGLLLSPGQNPHTFEPTARQVRDVSSADRYLSIGLPFEQAVISKVRGMNRNLVVTDVTAGIPRRFGTPHAHAVHDVHAADEKECVEGSDPHVWLTPSAMAILATNTAAVLVVCDPADRAGYEARLRQVVAELTSLDQEIQALLAPVRGGVMCTYHPSWGYFTDAYGLRQVTIEADGRAPAARQLAERIDHAGKEGVRRVFTEPPYDLKPVQTLARQIGAEVVVIDPLAESWDANLRGIALQVRDALIPLPRAR